MKNDVWAATRPFEIDPEDAAEQRSPLLDAKVMMVDDEPLMTELLQAHLEEEGYSNFVVCNDPRHALAILRRERPGVLLLDLMMPEVSGFELLEALRTDRDLRYTPVIVLTAAAGADSKLRALQLGATDFLSKPVDASELVLRVRNTLAFRQYHERLIHYDQVTGLPNEKLFERSVDELLAQQPLRGGLVALFSIAVPACRDLRESIGRPTADTLAAVLARRLDRVAAAATDAGAVANTAQRALRVARLGEQHFSLVLDGLPNTDAVEKAARAVLSALAEPVQLGLHEVVPQPWLGVSVAPGDG
ncbi:MAG: response regulator, partial [Rubrivivax sp.]|nr:response regulator [Rubrivivax sp.]